MTFTDDQLAWLKGVLGEEKTDEDNMTKSWRGILHRLECAEAYACECRELGADDTELYEAWRKSAGK